MSYQLEQRVYKLLLCKLSHKRHDKEQVIVPFQTDNKRASSVPTGRCQLELELGAWELELGVGACCCCCCLLRQRGNGAVSQPDGCLLGVVGVGSWELELE